MDEARKLAYVRLLSERDELTVRLERITEFIEAGDTFDQLDRYDQLLMKAQQFYMKKYLDVVTERLHRWED